MYSVPSYEQVNRLGQTVLSNNYRVKSSLFPTIGIQAGLPRLVGNSILSSQNNAINLIIPAGLL